MNTTEQARQQWCPMVRIGVRPDFGGPCTVNDPTSIEAFSGTCIAAKCAMWRWQDPAPVARDRIEWTCWDEESPIVEPTRPAEVHPDAVWVPFDGTEDENGGYWLEPQSAVDTEVAAANAQRRGFCGLAGRPEVAP